MPPDSYGDEIAKFLPDFSFRTSDDLKVYFVLRNLVPAGLFIAHLKEDCMLVDIDFVIPGYRDLRIGKFVYAQDYGLLKSEGVRVVYSKPGTQKHQEYLRKMGFQPFQTPEGDQLYRLQLA